MRLEDLEAFQVRTARVFDGRTPGTVARCHGCRVWKPWADLADQRLGFDTYCAPCIDRMARRALTRAGRLPQVDEFFCAGCESIRPLTEMTPPDADGRRRFRCRPCRKRQVQKAEVRR